jgi:hypothetical protein
MIGYYVQLGPFATPYRQGHASIVYALIFMSKSMERRLCLHPLSGLFAEAATVVSEPPFLECIAILETNGSTRFVPSLLLYLISIDDFVTRKRVALDEAGSFF